MKIKELILPLALAVLTTFLIRQFFLKDNTTGQKTAVNNVGMQVAPQSEEVRRPLNFEIDFVDTGKKKVEEKIFEIETGLAKYAFSSYGASLDRLEFKHSVNKKSEYLGTIFPLVHEAREQRCFLLALPEKTPYYYDFVGSQEFEDHFEVSYKTDSELAQINKKFTVYKDSFKIDLDVEINPKVKGEDLFTARILFPSPIFPAIEKDDSFNAFVSTGINDLEKKKYNEIEDWSTAYWTGRKIVGSDDRYFVHSMIADDNGFASRSYFNAMSSSKFISTLESSDIKKTQSWKMSFYFGPKDEKRFKDVAPALEKTFDYGWFALPAKGVLWFLNKANDYTNNYGWAIILLTLLLQIVMWPFNPQDEKKVKQRNEMQSKLKYIRQRYKDDPQMLAAKQKELIQKYGMGGMSGGCIGIFIQIPFFVALRMVLVNAIELYHAPFIFWMKDLSAPDVFYVLPAITVISMVLRAATVDPKQRVVGIIISLVFAAVIINFSTGLCLFITVGAAFGFLQTKLQKMMRKNG